MDKREKEKIMYLLKGQTERKRGICLYGMLILTGILMLLTTTVFAFWGEEIKELVRDKTETRRPFLTSWNGQDYLCISRECCTDDALFEICAEEGFFQTNYVLRKVPVELADVFPEEEYLVIVTKLNNATGRYFAVLNGEKYN
ncbi:MAG: hypothetical protein IKO03_01435 [Lachnospiraceae bacterium]|nr:hypothetical protein [Lachnospiraceae bacterium]